MTTTARAQGATVWLTGLPSAGKTTIARILGTRLKTEGHRVEVLDGDEIRRFLSAGLGFSREDRNTNVQRIGLVAEVLARNGVLAVVPVIAPYADSRDARSRSRRSPVTTWWSVRRTWTGTRVRRSWSSWRPCRWVPSPCPLRRASRSST
ncbi:adenylyl-sulfate kinase [Streptomyces sp. RLB1-33]|uniref:adenylyl-sulfate kinase n=1 Tax=Streptomyces mirabilis TaxID=68239 RepID=UPI002001E560|nr:MULTISPECIES: adenylyl-sulfate kinase [Streptomyces]